MDDYNPKFYGYCPYCMSFPHKAGCPNAEPMPEKVGECELCGDPIYSGENIYDVDGKKYHIGCFEDEYECTA